VQHRIIDGTVLDRGIGKDRVHHQNVLHEGEIGIVIGNIAERNQRCEKGYCRHEGGLAQPCNNHGNVPSPVKPHRCIRDDPRQIAKPIAMINGPQLRRFGQDQQKRAA